MKTIFSFPAKIISPESDRNFSNSLFKDFLQVHEVNMSQYFDFENLLLKDFEGGDIVTCSRREGFFIEVWLWSLCIPVGETRECLVNEVLAQVSDGYIEDGLEVDINENTYLLVVDSDREYTLRFVEDNKEVVGANPIAICLIKEEFSDLQTIANFKDYIDIPFRNLSPLHWAIFKRNLPAVEQLLEVGSNPNATSDDNITPLMRLAFDNGLSDQLCVEIGKKLIAHKASVNPDIIDAARSRGKSLLANLLEGKNN